MSFCCRMECDGPCQYQSRRVEPAPSPQPEMPDHAMTLLQTLPRVEILSYSDLTWALRKAGLRLIDAQQKAVLDACEALALGDCKLDEDGLTAGELEAVVGAELARRAAKEGTT